MSTLTSRLEALGRLLARSLYCCIRASAPFCQMQMITKCEVLRSGSLDISSTSRLMQAWINTVFPETSCSILYQMCRLPEPWPPKTTKCKS